MVKYQLVKFQTEKLQTEKFRTVYLGLGSNLRNKKNNIKKALKLLDQTVGIKVKSVSKFYKTKPMYVAKQPDFLNGVVKINCSKRPEELLVLIKDIERIMGRRKLAARYGPRIIDIDILLYGKKIIRTAHLNIPHQRLLERPFVLKPLLEIAPGIVHPVLKKRIAS